MNIAQAYFFSFYSQIPGKGTACSGFNWSCEVLALDLFLKVIIAKYFGRDGHAIDVAAPCTPGTVIVVVDSLQTDNSLLVIMLSVGMDFGNDAQSVFRKHAVFVCLHNVAYSKVFCINHCLPPFLLQS